MERVDFISLEMLEAAKCLTGIFVILIFGRVCTLLEKIERKMKG